MTPDQFNNIFQDTMMELERLVDFKGGQYAPGNNRLHNFDYAAEILQCSPLEACQGMWSKQLVTLLDAIKTAREPQRPWSQDRCDEVINDLLVYLILTKAIFYREYGWEPQSKKLNKICRCQYKPTKEDQSHFIWCPLNPECHQ